MMSKTTIKKITDFPKNRHYKKRTYCGNTTKSLHNYNECKISLPECHLEIVANLLGYIEWVQDALVYDAVLYVKLSGNERSEVQERSLRKILPFILELKDSALTDLGSVQPAKTKEPYILENYKAYRNVGVTKTIRAPNGENPKCFVSPLYRREIRFGIIKSCDSENFEGYYVLSRDPYIDPHQSVAASLLRATMPSAGIGTMRKDSWEEIPIENNVPGIADMAIACYKKTFELKAKIQKYLETLEFKGKPTAFSREDNEARNLLQEYVINGGKIHRYLNTTEDDYDRRFRYYDDEGMMLPCHIVERLSNSGIIQIEGWPIYEKEGEGLKSYVYNQKYKGELDFEKHVADFTSFKDACRYYKHETSGFRECSNPKKSGDTCTCSSCPLVMPVYENDLLSYGFSFEDDPITETYDHDDFDVRPIHPNTVKSYAWKWASSAKSTQIIDEAANAKYHTGINDYLVEESRAKYVEEAVATGKLIIVKEMTGLGIIVRLSDEILNHIDDLRKAA